MLTHFLEVLDPLISISSNAACVLLAAYAVTLGAPPSGGVA